MSLFRRMFGRKANGGPTDSDPALLTYRAERADRAAELHRAYWTRDAAEQAHLERFGVERLNWRERVMCLTALSV